MPSGRDSFRRNRVAPSYALFYHFRQDAGELSVFRVVGLLRFALR